MEVPDAALPSPKLGVKEPGPSLLPGTASVAAEGAADALAGLSSLFEFCCREMMITFSVKSMLAVTGLRYIQECLEASSTREVVEGICICERGARQHELA